MSTKRYFYCKDKSRRIVPVDNPELEIKAAQKINEIVSSYDNLPALFKHNLENLKLYSPSGNVEKAQALLLDPDNGAYDVTNKLNHLTGKEWTKFTCSWFIFNALKSDLQEEQAVTKETAAHPATFSPTMISDFIKFFTKEGAKVIDPFCGIGTTLVACRRTNRIGYGIELNPKYYDISLQRVPEFQANIFNGDCRDFRTFDLPIFDYSISSPPYWDVLNRSTDGFKKEREGKGLDSSYSASHSDLGNINDYDTFLQEVCKVYLGLYDLLRTGAYITVIVKNIKKCGRMYPLAWDMAKILGEKYVLKDEKIWIQDKIGLSPYGYPHSWASNILHHYCLILRKE